MPRIPAKVLLLGGAIAGVAGALRKRDKLAGLIGSRTSRPAPTPTSPTGGQEPHPVGPSNYDAPGPPANTATPVPVPQAVVDGTAIDEAAEADAAAAEAAAIGGPAPRYEDKDDPTMSADDADRPLMESGEGWEEGEELAREDQIDAATPHDTKSPYERQIEDAIEAHDNPFTGEAGEVLESGASYAETGNPEADTAGYPSPPPRQEPGADPSAPPEKAPADPADRPGAEGDTWSGRAAAP
jgi:hypothetical protein